MTDQERVLVAPAEMALGVARKEEMTGGAAWLTSKVLFAIVADPWRAAPVLAVQETVT